MVAGGTFSLFVKREGHTTARFWRCARNETITVTECGPHSLLKVLAETFLFRIARVFLKSQSARSRCHQRLLVLLVNASETQRNSFSEHRTMKELIKEITVELFLINSTAQSGLR